MTMAEDDYHGWYRGSLGASTGSPGRGDMERNHKHAPRIVEAQASAYGPEGVPSPPRCVVDVTGTLRSWYSSPRVRRCSE